MLYAIIILFLFLSLTIILKKRKKSIYYLPVILLLIEISRNITDKFLMIEEGYNGVIFIVLSLFVVFNLKLVKDKLYFVLVLIIFISTLFYLTRLNYNISFYNNLSRLGSLVLIMALVPISYINRFRISRKEIQCILTRLFIIFFTYTIFASLAKFGPNHYHTDIIYGFKFDQWYIGALLIVTIPFYKINGKRTILEIFFFFLCLLLIMLVLRRTVWLIIFLSFILIAFILRKGIFKNKYFVKLLGVGGLLLLIIIPFFYFNAWGYRAGRAIDSDLFSEEYYEKEARFTELDNTIYILYNKKQLMLGTGFLFDEKGRYNYPNPNRPMHGTYTRIFFGAGSIGLCLYLYFLLNILYHLYDKNITKDYFKTAIFSSFAVYLIVLVGGASGSGTGAPYVATLFILSGYLINNVTTRS